MLIVTPRQQLDDACGFLAGRWLAWRFDPGMEL